MDIQFNMNDIPKSIFTESSHFIQECESLSTNNNSFDIAIEGAHSVINLINKTNDINIIDEMKSIIKETEKNISKNILMEIYSFSKRHECGDACNTNFCVCKYTNLDKNVPNLSILINVLTEVITRVNKYKNNFTYDVEDDFEDTLKDLCDMIRDRSESIYGSILCKEKNIDTHNFIEEMYLTFRNEDQYFTEEYSGDNLGEYENSVEKHYLGIGDSIKTYNSDIIKCLKMFSQAISVLHNDPHYSHDINKWLTRTREALELYILRYLFISNIAYAGKADAIHDYMNPNNISYGAHINNDEPLDLEMIYTELKNKNIDVKIFDIQRDAPKKLNQVLEEYKPTITYINGVVKQVPFIKEYNHLIKSFNSNIKTIVGGNYAEYNYQDFYEEDVDYIVRSYDPSVITEIVNYNSEKKNDLNDLNGLCFKDNDKWITTNIKPVEINDLPIIN